MIERHFVIGPPERMSEFVCVLDHDVFGVRFLSGPARSLIDLALECPEPVAADLQLLDVVNGCHRSGLPVVSSIEAAGGINVARAKETLISRLKSALVDAKDFDEADSLLRGAVSTGVLANVSRSLAAETDSIFEGHERQGTATLCSEVAEDATRLAEAFSADRGIGLLLGLRLEKLRRKLDRLMLRLGNTASYIGFPELPDARVVARPVIATACEQIAQQATFVSSALRGAALPRTGLSRQIRTRAALDVLERTVFDAAMPVWKERAESALAALERPDWSDPRLARRTRSEKSDRLAGTVPIAPVIV